MERGRGDHHDGRSGRYTGVDRIWTDSVDVVGEVMDVTYSGGFWSDTTLAVLAVR